MLSASVLSGPREDIVSFLGPLLGKAKVEGFVTGLEAHIRNEARKGAEEAIPRIKAEVKTTVSPYVIGALAAGGIGALLGLAGFIKARRK